MTEKPLNYCNSLTKYSRLETRKVNVGDIAIGGEEPIRVQSMTTTNTLNTKETVEQSIRMIKEGCELVRITAPSIKDEEFQRHILQGVSRTFALTIPQLPGDLCRTVSNAYLLCRIADTIEDDAGLLLDDKRALSEQFVGLVEGHGDSRRMDL